MTDLEKARNELLRSWRSAQAASDGQQAIVESMRAEIRIHEQCSNATLESFVCATESYHESMRDVVHAISALAKLIARET